MEELLEQFSGKLKQFRRAYNKFKRDQSNFPQLDKIVREIEGIQKQIEIQSGIAEAKKMVHDIAIHIPTLSSRQGSFNTEALLNFITQINTIMDAVTPGARSILEYNIVGVSPGSTTLLGDFDPINDDEDELTTERINDTKETLQKVLKATKSLTRTGPVSEKVQEFEDSTGMDLEKAYEVSKAVIKMHPGPSGLMDAVDIQVNTPSERVSSSFIKGERLNSEKTKKEIYARIKPEEDFELTGKLGIMEEWDTNHKISIIDNDTHKITTINYDPTRENIAVIKTKIGKNVTIRRMKNPEDKRQWILEEWVN